MAKLNVERVVAVVLAHAPLLPQGSGRQMYIGWMERILLILYILLLVFIGTRVFVYTNVP